MFATSRRRNSTTTRRKAKGLHRFAAIRGRAIRSENLSMGETHVGPLTVSANHPPRRI
ncbi:hypothetical protein I553_0584 [Mycobacterium xenopi 4042]|uniref:Uncharacterized protein n=1 Tax=Mycobacterium xenopi 4042 TaxID=1299334 RepID=X7YJ10_MYCXE|nr:hypothetical protein I553_0584 [Mycobacterium xenopi 4042]